jgi:co-chaperonin GroES (HSP10)
MNVVKGKIIPLKDHVLVTDMNFGEQQTSSGIVIKSDDGKSEGVKPRWGRVWAVGPTQKDFTVGEWILVEHGRWTRGATVEDQDGNEIVIRRVETTSILASSDQKPNGVQLGSFASPQHGSVHNPEDFVRL